MGVSMTPDVWSQRQMDEEVDKAGENRRLLWRSRKTLLGASGVPMAHCKLQGNRGSKLRWYTCFKVLVPKE